MRITCNERTDMLGRMAARIDIRLSTLFANYNHFMDMGDAMSEPIAAAADKAAHADFKRAARINAAHLRHGVPTPDEVLTVLEKHERHIMSVMSGVPFSRLR